MARVRVNLTLAADVANAARSLGHHGGRRVVDLHTNPIRGEAWRIVDTLPEASRYAVVPGLTPAVDYGGTTWIVRVQDLAAGPGAEMRDRVGSRADKRDALKQALGILIDGV